MSNFVDKCREANAIFLSNPVQSEYVLAEILEKTLSGSSVFKQVSTEDYSIVGRTYVCLLDRMSQKESRKEFLNSLSCFGYYFTSKAINNGYSDSYLDRILILNIGARTFYKTVASATGQNVYSSYINFNDLINLPTPVKYVLLMEYCDHLKICKGKNITPDFLNRKNALDSLVYGGLFDSICGKDKIVVKGGEIHQKVLAFLENDFVPYFLKKEV